MWNITLQCGRHPAHILLSYLQLYIEKIQFKVFANFDLFFICFANKTTLLTVRILMPIERALPECEGRRRHFRIQQKLAKCSDCPAWEVVMKVAGSKVGSSSLKPKSKVWFELSGACSSMSCVLRFVCHELEEMYIVQGNVRGILNAKAIVGYKITMTSDIFWMP